MCRKIFHKIKQWIALKKAKKEESVKVPAEEDIKGEEKRFEEEAMELKGLIIKQMAKKAVKKSVKGIKISKKRPRKKK